MLAYVETHEGDALNETKQFFMPPGIFDGIISVLMQELNKKPIRPYLCDPTGRKAILRQFVEKIRQVLKTNKHQVKDFSEICEAIPMMRL